MNSSACLLARVFGQLFGRNSIYLCVNPVRRIAALVLAVGTLLCLGQRVAHAYPSLTQGTTSSFTSQSGTEYYDYVDFNWEIKNPSGTVIATADCGVTNNGWYANYNESGTVTVTVPSSATVATGYWVASSNVDEDAGGGYFNVAGGGVPGAPTSPSATASGESVNLSWTAPSGTVTSYNVYRGTSSGAESSTALETGVTTTSYTDTAVSYGTRYYYKVTAVNSSGEGAVSSEANALVGSTISAPSGITLYSGDGQTLLYWSAVTGALSYDVFRAPSGGSYTLVASGVTSSISLGYGSTPIAYGDTGLTNGSTYDYEISSVNSTGPGPASSPVLSYPTNVGLPTTPAFPAATAGSSQATLQADTESSFYYMGTASGTEGNIPVSTTGDPDDDTTNFNATGLTNGTTYYFQMTLLGVSGGHDVESERSTEVSATPGSTLLSAPTISINITNNLAPILSWTSVSGATGYNILCTQYKLLPLPIIIASLSSSASSYTDTTESYGADNTYSVAAVSANGMGNHSTVTDGMLSGFGVIALPSSITIARGNSGVVTIEEPAAENSEGQYQAAFLGGIALSVSGLPSGVSYWCAPPVSIVPAYAPPGQLYPILANYSNGTYLTITVPSGASTGTYTLTLTGTSQTGASYSFTQTTTMSLTIT